MNLHVVESVNETHVRVLTKGQKFKFSENFAYILNEWP